MDSVKINRLEIENIKRVKAVTLTPSVNGLTIIGGNNNQGKTSVLDAIAWALGGDRYRPTAAHREGSMIPPSLHVELSNGIVVDRAGKNGDLKVTDVTGKRGGQQLLNEFVEQLALDLPKFLHSSGKEKAETLLKIIGVGDELRQMEFAEQRLYNSRLEIGRIAEQKAKYAAELPQYDGVPDVPVEPGELIRQQQSILLKNAENQKKRDRLFQYKRELIQAKSDYDEICKRLAAAEENVRTAETDAADLQDESTAELEENIRNIDLINAKVRTNLDKQRAVDEAAEYRRQYDGLTAEIESVRGAKKKLLEGAHLPLPELSVQNGELIYKGQQWDCMSNSDRLRVAVAIVREINPKCGFVLMDELEQMDEQTLWDFGDWLNKQGLQVIATRVSTGDECSIIIEDGYGIVPEEKTEPKKWKAGEF